MPDTLQPLPTAELMTLAEAARFLRISPRTLWGLVQRPDGPPVLDLAPTGARRRTLRFRRTELVRWLAEREQRR